jgi:uncharacterized damage-inducible protein DinB
MTFEDVQTLLEYNDWARERLFVALDALTPEQLTRPLGNSFPSIFDTLVHLYGAEWVWRSRWDGESPAALPAPSAFADLTAVRAAWDDEQQRIRAIVNRLGPEGVTRPIEYRGWDGKTYAQPFWQMFQHVVNHGSYHRGQVTTMLRQLGAAPPKSMDLIAFYRERANAQV